MQTTIHPEVEKLLGDTPNVEQFINDVLLVYLSGGFIRSSDVLEKFVVDRIFRKRADNLTAVFDSLTQQFQGLAVIGKTDSETLWVASPRLHDALEANTDILIMKSPRQRGISIKVGKDVEVPAISKENFS